MNEIQKYQSGPDDLCEVIVPLSTGVAGAVKDFFRGPSNRQMLFRTKVMDMQYSHEERLKLLDTAVELAKLDHLSDDEFRILMVAFAERR